MQICLSLLRSLSLTNITNISLLFQTRCVYHKSTDVTDIDQITVKKW